MTSIRSYALVTGAYWGFTITDGALRMLVVLHFYKLGYDAVSIAFLFLFYEFFGIVTNLFGGWIASRSGVKVTLYGGLVLQIGALFMLTLLNPAWPRYASVAFVMAAQALSGIAKDLTKMSAKSAIKVIVPAGSDSALFKWVARLTGSKNALKGAGFFAGGALLSAFGFNGALAQRVLRGLRIVAMRQHSARGADFDQVGAVLDVLAHLVLDRLDAIGHAFALRVVLKRQQIVVAVSARNAQGRPADQHARSRHVAGVNGIAQGNVGKAARAHVADGRKTGFERHPGIARSDECLDAAPKSPGASSRNWWAS